ncbi:unnamed protein product [Clavelina lepadiformis]|uniref:Uncharacterized protein n=1 Tax=Clavelina lepadiformis TaxID=159417 RepID=A0ABP0GUZ9_CLALP
MGNDNSPKFEEKMPPLYYCWRGYLVDGKVNEGCNDVLVSPKNFLDLNKYGWVYLTIPVLGFFLLTFLFYCFCRGGSSKVKRQPLLSDDSDIDNEDDFRTRAKSHPQHRGLPKNNDARNYYTVVPIDPADPRKLPMQGGVAVPPPNAPQQRLYPRLTAMRQQAGLNSHPRGKNSTTSHPKNSSHLANVYQPDPTSPLQGGKNGKAPKVPVNEPLVNDQNRQDQANSSEESEEEQ